MLTPEVVKSKEFQATGRGAYRADDVDGFFAEVSASYEQMFKENGELIKKISILANKVEQYKEEEDSLRKALISAQTLADKIVKDAKESVEGTIEQAQVDGEKMRAEAKAEAQAIVEKAKAEADAVILQSKKDADEILGAVNRKVMKESLEFEMLQKKAAEFRANLLNLYKEHLNSINSIPEYVEKEMPAEETPAQEAAPETAPVEAPVEAPASEEPQVSAEETPAPEAPEQITLETAVHETAAEDAYEDISSSSDDDAEDLSVSDDETDGFSLDLSALDDDEEDEAEEAVAEPAASVAPARTYATIEDSEAAKEDDEDDDDDEPVSFKSFFKKK